MIETRAGVEPVPVVAPRPRGTTLRSVTLHALAAALMYRTPLLVFVPAAFISSGLRSGWRGIWSAILISAAIVAGASLLISPFSADDLSAVLDLVFQMGIPSVAVLLMLRRGVSFGQVVLIAVGIAALGFLLEEVLLQQLFEYSRYDSLANNMRTNWEKQMAAQSSLGIRTEGLELMRRIMHALTGPFMPSLLVAASVLTFIMSLVMIPRLPAGRATGDRYLFRNLRWPVATLFGFIAGGAVPLLAAGPLRLVVQNVLAITILLYLIQGLAIFRTLVWRMGIGLLGTLFAYVLLGLLALWGVAPFILFLAGLFDPFFDFRNLQRKGESDESHSD